MYGLVNNALETLLVELYGPEKWEAIKVHSNIDHDFFLNNESYDDGITYKLVGAASVILGLSVKEILNALGEFWILRTGKENYGSMLEAGGSTLAEFLHNLPVFHTRVMLLFPHLTPPEFQVYDAEEDRAVYLHYFSKRAGLQEMVRGLLSGIGKMYQTPVSVELLQSRDDGHDHEIFKVRW